jgi:hypothetical protein
MVAASVANPTKPGAHNCTAEVATWTGQKMCKRSESAVVARQGRESGFDEELPCAMVSDADLWLTV